MGIIYVGVGEYAISNRPDDIIKTMALGSCVGVIALAQELKMAALLHVALPESSINKQRSIELPGMFADSGIEALIKDLKKAGYNGNSNLIIKLAGGATIMDPNNTFNIGKRNLLAVRKILWKYRLGAIAEDVEGTISRTVTITLDTGQVVISSPGRGEWEL
jgi:chemotaxis protein CheD